MSQQSRYKRLISLLAAGSLPFIAQPVWSAGFALSEQNASGLGTSYAGAGSIAEDASTGYYNAAGLTRLGEEQIVGSAVWILPNSTLTATSATANIASPTTGRVIPLGAGSTSTDADAIAPGLHYAKRIDDCWVFGLSVASPFGLKTKYPNDSIARYMATRSDLKTIDIGPSIAYNWNGFSIGVGADALYLVAKLDSRIGLGNVNTDGLTESTASNWGLGYHAGVLYEFTDCTRIGLSYRSQVKVNPRGETINQFLAAGLPETRYGLRSKITLPDSVLLSAYHAFNEQWAVMADVQWMHWSLFKTLPLNLYDGTKALYKQYYRNTVRASLGGSYQWNDQVRLRLGTAYDKTPTQDTYRSIRIPDERRYWASVGAQYRFTKCFAIDVGYAHLFFKKAKINETAPALVQAGSAQSRQGLQTFNGTSKGRADLIGIQLTWDFV